jgi:hypothetical protein
MFWLCNLTRVFNLPVDVDICYQSSWLVATVRLLIFYQLGYTSNFAACWYCLLVLFITIAVGFACFGFVTLQGFLVCQLMMIFVISLKLACCCCAAPGILPFGLHR